MTIRAIILDLSDTLLDNSNQALPGTQAMISRLKRQSIEVFIASNNSYHGRLLKNLFAIDESRYLYPRKVGGKKGTGSFIRYVCNLLGASSNNLLYLGDTEWDFYEAVNSNVIFFLASWGENPEYQYGMTVNSLSEFADIVEIFFLKSVLWYCSVDGQDGLGRDVILRALLDPDVPKVLGITTLLKTKGQQGTRAIKEFSTEKYLSLHLLASIYLEGLHLKGLYSKPIWCMYPGHDGVFTPVLDNFITIVTRLFREQYRQGLIIRHTFAPSSSRTRWVDRQIPTIDTQFRTIHLDPTARERLRNQTVIVIDDFTTGGHSFETSRNFLYNAGVNSVICVAVGKYGSSYEALYPKAGVKWDSFSPSHLTRSNFDSNRLSLSIDANALTVF